VKQEKMDQPEKTLGEKYPPSPACTCDVCRTYCVRPGWWTVREAASAMDAGYAGRMMLEMSPDLSYGVLSPAFKGSEGNFASNECAKNGCNFLARGLCELYKTAFQPLECRFCHHDRAGLGMECHLDLEKDWNTPIGQAVIAHWGAMTGLWERSKAHGMNYPGKQP
jgi:hypothetical protein